MSNFELSTYNLDELVSLFDKIEDEVKARQKNELGAARKQILAIAREAGLSVDELFAEDMLKPIDTKKRKKREAPKPKAQYQNPANRSQFWSGRGRQPKWITEGLAGGKQLSDFRIESAH